MVHVQTLVCSLCSTEHSHGKRWNCILTVLENVYLNFISVNAAAKKRGNCIFILKNFLV